MKLISHGEPSITSALTSSLFLLAVAMPAAAFTGDGNASSLAAGLTGPKGEIDPVVIERLNSGIPQELIVLYDDSDVEREVSSYKRKAVVEYDDDEAITLRLRRYRSLKQRIESGLHPGEAETVRDYSHLPMSFIRFRSRAALGTLLARPEVIAVYENRPIYPSLTQSLPLINQPATISSGYTGSGSTVAVIDTGINYTLGTFGSCTAPGVPAGCRVAASVDVTGNGVTLNPDPAGHGTNVAGIVAGAATGARIAAVNAFSAGTSSSDWVIAGINWAIANRTAYNIAAMNLSLGDGTNYTSACNTVAANPFLKPLNNARAAGIQPVASAGNEGYTNGISSPACTPGVISVGAVYDGNVGGLAWGICTDPATAANQVACFSNSAGFLTMLAPGALIAAAGSTMGGTSQASPHVAAAVAILRSGFPAETLDQTIARLTSNGLPVTDPRNGLVKPRLNLLSALGRPANDDFAAKKALTGSFGLATATNANATMETGEANHAGNSGGKSVWWSWRPAVGGQVTINTHNSNFDTLLAVYTGTAVGSLLQVAASDNDESAGNASGLSFAAQAGTDYLIAVDGFNGAFGAINLAWGPAPAADLSVTMSGSSGPVAPGGTITYDLSVANQGPMSAVNAVLIDSLPAGVDLLSVSPGCSAAGSTITCSLGTLAANAAVGLQIAVSPASGGSFTNSAALSSTTYDPASGNNIASVTTEVTALPAAVPALSPWGIAAAIALAIWNMRGEFRKRRVR